MISTERIYPYVLDPKETPAIWGGDALVKRYGKSGAVGAAIGESWECWDANVVDNGVLAGATLAQLRRDLGAELMGPIDSAQPFPILTKIIDAQQALSVQVHPDDAYAQRIEGQPNGKTECWYILEAQPGAELVLGWTRDTDREEYERRVADGTLGEILRRVPVKAGEAYYLPAGTLHAIGAGIVLFETQQTSDLTYRIFDWNRVGTDGKPRALHIEKAADVLDFRATLPSAVTPLPVRDGDLERTLLVADRRFLMERVRAAAGATIATHGRPLTITALATPLDLQIDGQRTDLPPYGTVVIPACAPWVVSRTPGEMLVARPEPRLDIERETARRAGIADERIARFFEQFG